MSRSGAILRGAVGEGPSFISLLQSPDAVTEATVRRQGFDREAVREEARQEGYAAGYLEGRAAGEREGYYTGRQEGFESARREVLEQESAHIADFAKRLATLQDELEQASAAWFEAAERQLEELAIQIARQVVAGELRTEPDTVAQLVKDALSGVPHADSARIRVNPFDRPDLERRKTDLMSASASLRNIEIVDDPEIRGGCRVESAGGVIEATVEYRFTALEASLKEAA